MTGALVAVLYLLLPSAPGAAQRAEPLRKTGLIRLLTGGTLSKSEIADLVRRSCLSFTPTARDRQDLAALGADAAIMGRVDACGRPAAAPASAAVPSRGATAAPPPFDRTSPPLTRPQPAAAPPAAPATPAARPDRIVAVPAAARTGFVSGTGQRGVVGQRAPLPLVFETRDSSGASLAGVAVTLTASNGQLAPEAGGGMDRTDSTGQVRAAVILGEQASATVVTAVVGRIVRQATLYPAAGPAARLAVTYRGQSVERELVVDADAPAALRVMVQDAFGNRVARAGPGVVAAVADAGIMRVTRVTPDTLTGGAIVLLRPGRPGRGNTTLVLSAGPVRLDLRVSVRARR